MEPAEEVAAGDDRRGGEESERGSTVGDEGGGR